MEACRRFRLPVGDIEGARADSFVDDDLLGLWLGADEEDLAAFGNDRFEGFVGSVDSFNGLGKIDDVDAIAGAIDEAAHLWVPLSGLVSEVNSRFEEFLHGDDRSVWIMHDLGHGWLRIFRLNDGFLDFVTHFGDLHSFMPPLFRRTDHRFAF